MSLVQTVLTEIEALPWPEVIPQLAKILEAIDKSAANPYERFALETVIAILYRSVPPETPT